MTTPRTGAIEPRFEASQYTNFELMDEESYLRWLALGRVNGLGCMGFKKLAEQFTDPTDAFAASRRELSTIGLGKDAVEGLLQFSAWGSVRVELDRAREQKVALVRYTDEKYPAFLRAIADPPPVLYWRGPLAIAEKCVAVVGSRSASRYGERITYQLAQELAFLGFTIVSGMARGIDAAAHAAVLSRRGRTIAVLGSGVDVPYPGENKGLYDEIASYGAVVSEFAMGTRPLPHHFPVRNRIISGLALGVVVVEATERSGSLITARLALEQGREVFAVPGEAGASRSRGTHRLLREGAKLVENATDVVEEIAPQLLSVGSRMTRVESGNRLDLSEAARSVLDLVRGGPLQIDEIIGGSGLSPAGASEILLQLELQGLLRQLPGKRFELN